MGISATAINSIIHDYLKLRKVCARWVPHQLTDDQKQWRIQFCRHSLKRFEEGQSRRVFDIITGDESWFYHYDPETKDSSGLIPKFQNSHQNSECLVYHTRHVPTPNPLGFGFWI